MRFGMRNYVNVIIVMLFITVSSCSTMLKAPTVIINSSLVDYKYFYVNPTQEKIVSKSVTSGGKYYSQSSVTTESFNPADVISGILMKHGYIILPQLKPELVNETFIVNYGEVGKRNVGIGYTLEVTIQIISAKNNELICSSTAEGMGSDERDDLRIAINRALESLFNNSK